MRGQPSLATNAAEAGEQMLSLAMGMWSWGWQITSCVSLCPGDAVTLLIPQTHVRSDLISLEGPVGADTGTVGPPAPLSLNHPPHAAYGGSWLLVFLRGRDSFFMRLVQCHPKAGNLSQSYTH